MTIRTGTAQNNQNRRKPQKGKSQKGQKAQKGAERTFWGWSAKKIGAKRGGSTGG